MAFLNQKRTTKFCGDFGETEASRYLRKKGFRIKERNYRASGYEIDIIAENRELIVFVEVKARTVPYLDADGTSPYAVTPAMAVNKEKQRHIVSAARQYLGSHPTDKMIRLDVVEIYLRDNSSSLEVLKIHHIENAFGA